MRIGEEIQAVPRQPVRVVAAAQARGGSTGPELLIAQRPPGSWREGWWEFPGGKIEPDESGEQALVRELREELGVELGGASGSEPGGQAAQGVGSGLVPLGAFRHEYPDRSVEIHLWLVTRFEGEPCGLDGQALRWIAPDELASCGLLEADQPMIAPLRHALEGVKLGP
jgi:8-oxo-dGTP diphosphatase